MEIVAIKVYLARPVYSIYSRTIFMDGSRIRCRNFYYLNKTFTYIIFPIEEMKFLEFRAVTYYQLFELIKISISNNSITRKFDNKIKKYSYQRRFYVSCSFT